MKTLEKVCFMWRSTNSSLDALLVKGRSLEASERQATGTECSLQDESVQNIHSKDHRSSGSQTSKQNVEMWITMATQNRSVHVQQKDKSIASVVNPIIMLGCAYAPTDHRNLTRTAWNHAFDKYLLKKMIHQAVVMISAHTRARRKVRKTLLLWFCLSTSLLLMHMP